MKLEDNDNDNNNGWAKYHIFVTEGLERVEAKVDKIDGRVIELKIDLAQLKIKAGIWGALAGSVPASIVGLLVWFITR